MIRSGVIGAGVFGNYHSQKYINHELTDFIGVFDTDYRKACHLSDQHGGQAFRTIEHFLQSVDVLTIATPAIFHGKYGELALRHGKHVLIEKPLAADSQTAHSLVKLAKKKNLVLRVGHQERFVVQQTGIFDAPCPKRIKSKRISPYSQRGLDVSVTLDLMTHDIDMALALMRDFPVRIESQIQKRDTKSNHPDYARARLLFTEGREVVLEASRMGEAFDRQMYIEFEEGEVEIDYVNKSFSHNTPYNLNPDFAQHPSARDSLGAGVNQFLCSVMTGERVTDSAEAGACAVEIAHTIDLGQATNFKKNTSKTALISGRVQTLDKKEGIQKISAGFSSKEKPAEKESRLSIQNRYSYVC